MIFLRLAKYITPIIVGVGLAGCNVVPPLDCLAGANREGCQRDANGNYGYLYRSALTPNGSMDPPVYYAAPQPISHTTCSRFGNTMQCDTY